MGPEPDPLVRGTDPRILIRSTKMSRIHNTDRYTIQLCQIQTYMNAKVQR